MPKDAYYIGSRRLVSQDDAALIQKARVPRSKFTNQWTRLTTFDAGYIVPFMVNEILPGDHMRYSVTAYIRMATALFPLFSNQRLDTFFFFVPSRLVWDNWIRLQGEQDTPASSINFTVPVINISDSISAIASIYDHMGLPVATQITAGQTIPVNALPFRAYNLIYNTWFRDQNIINSWPVNNISDGPDTSTDYVLKRRAKSHDYFTSALPWPQKFTPLQTLFTGTAPVVGIGVIDATNIPANGSSFRESDGGAETYTAAYIANSGGGLGVKFNSAAVASALNPPQIYADLAQATGVTINALRQAWLVQDLLERDARGGTRYIEIIRSHFGVISPDFRLQRPEYIGGGQTPINITPIAQTATGGGGLGALGGVGSAVGSHSASYAATEHGYILGLINIRTELAYQQGLHRMWSKSTRYDFYMPSLAGLGEQAILRQEIYATGTDALDATVFGYQERWHEYRTEYSQVAGMFRSTSAGNIDEWHLAQEFSAAPTLSQAFIEDTPPMTRVLAAGSSANNMQYLADILINRTAVRPIPMFGTPASLARM